MIVVDTNVLAYFWVPGEFTEAARRLATLDGDWKVPPLWRSEFRNVLATLVRNGRMKEGTAVDIVRAAENQMVEGECAVDSEAILRLAASSGASAYDCEFVALATDLDVALVTSDQKLVRAFPGRARLLADSVREAR
ncbi:MAG: type II toxin-antitoxin system VapC family toxin [Acidobacteria bacterium]|nr:type II toxin-antitoxin system VapC family toxin [Acidobacteriota bacterium]